MDTSTFWYIQGLDLFANRPDLRDEIRREGRLERWGHRANISHREEPGEVHVIVDGRVQLYDPYHDTTLKLGRSALFGVTASGSPDTNLHALDDTVIAALPRKRFDELTSMSLGTLDTQVGIVRRQRLSVPVSLLLYTQPRSRLAGVIVHLIEEYGSLDDQAGALAIAPRTRTFARLSGLADRTVSDIFEEMTKEKVIEVGTTSLVVPNLEQIRNLALQ